MRYSPEQAELGNFQALEIIEQAPGINLVAAAYALQRGEQASMPKEGYIVSAQVNLAAGTCQLGISQYDMGGLKFSGAQYWANDPRKYGFAFYKTTDTTDVRASVTQLEPTRTIYGDGLLLSTAEVSPLPDTDDHQLLIAPIEDGRTVFHEARTHRDNKNQTISLHRLVDTDTLLQGVLEAITAGMNYSVDARKIFIEEIMAKIAQASEQRQARKFPDRDPASRWSEMKRNFKINFLALLGALGIGAEK